MNNTAVILASGQGKRMRAQKNKVFLTLKRKPLIYYAIKSFQTSPWINKIILVGKPEEKTILKKIIKTYSFNKVVEIISGGKERQDSCHNAILYLKQIISKDQKNSIVLFHNGANPFVSQKEILTVIKAALKYGAAAVAHPTKDTIKKVNSKKLVEETLDRSKLWNMQTPQAIRFNLARISFDLAKKENFLGTDDVSLVERMGKRVKIVLASEFNFKITTPLDLELAKIIINKKYV